MYLLKLVKLLNNDSYVLYEQIFILNLFYNIYSMLAFNWLKTKIYSCFIFVFIPFSYKLISQNT